MKYRVDNLHREFFSQNGWIELEGLVSTEELVEVNRLIDLVLAEREDVKPERLRKLGSQALFLAGRDVWRGNEGLRKFVCSRRFSELAVELVEIKPLRLAMDQVYTYLPANELPNAIPGSGSLSQSLASFQGLACGLILCLECAAEAPPSFFPTKPGNGLCVSPDLELNIEQIYRGPEQRYLLIGYGRAVTLFIHRPQDPHATALKKLGYHYGDRLLDRLHPVVIR